MSRTNEEPANDRYGENKNADNYENPDTGLDTIWYTEDYCINVYYEAGH